MNETSYEIHNERVDDIPLLVQMLQQMGVDEEIDAVTPRHGNRLGLSVGETAVAWLTYIVSESDHRLSFVEPWAEQHIETLRCVLSEQVRTKDLTDDALADVLKVMSDDSKWEVMEERFNWRHLRAFRLPTERVRLDATAVAMHHNQEGSALIAYGKSKDHRPDLAQVKVFIAGLDPLALPLATTVVSGNRADDRLYIPAIERVRATVGKRGLLYVGDSKMEALATRAHVVRGGDYYLHPLSKKGESGQQLEHCVNLALKDPSQLTIIEEREQAAPDKEKWLVRGREWRQSQSAEIDGELVTWEERLLLFQSSPLQEQQRRGLEKRLTRAIGRLERLTPPPKQGRKQFRELAPLQEEVNAILAKYRVEAFVEVIYHEEVKERHVRKYGNRPAHIERTVRYWIEVKVDAEAIEAAHQLMGWRLLVTNAPASRLSLADAVRTYRGNAPTIERLFSRLKGRPLGLRPLYVRRDDHIKGLIRLLTIALRLLTLIEFVVRRALEELNEALPGLFPGNPSRLTSRPTAERLLRAFKGIDLTIVTLPQRSIQHITPLSPLQNRILQLLKFSDSIYTSLAHAEPIPI